MQIWANNGTNAQKWKVTHDSNGYATLTSVNSGKVLDVNGGVSASGTNVQQYLEWCQCAAVYRKWHECPKVGEIADRLTNKIWLRTSIFLLSAIFGICAISGAASWRIDWRQ